MNDKPELLERLSSCVENGKINQAARYPPNMRDQHGADELCREAVTAGIPPDQILGKGLVCGMSRIGERFSQGKAFVPEMLLAARAMTAAMAHLKPFFSSGAVKRKGVFVVGTVAGDLHDIGKSTRDAGRADERRVTLRAGLAPIGSRVRRPEPPLHGGA